MARYRKPPTPDQYVDPEFHPTLIPGIGLLDGIARIAINQGDITPSQLDGLRSIAGNYVARHARDPDPLATERCYQAALKSLNFEPSRAKISAAMWGSCRSVLPPPARPTREE